MASEPQTVFQETDKRAKNLVWLVWILTILALLYHLAILTNGRFDLFRADIHGKVFNSMLLNLLQGDFTVDPAAIAGEAMVKDGKTYSYFGTFPAVFRGLFLPFLDLEKSWVGRISVFSALAISLVFQVKTWLLVFRSVAPTPFSRHIFLIVLISLLGSSPHLFLAGNASVYHEPIIWAAAATSVFNYLLVRSTLNGESPGTGSLYIMASMAGICVHSRVHIAIGLYLALLLLIFIDYSFRRHGRFRPAGKTVSSHDLIFRVIGPLLVLGLFGLAYLGINYGRWGDPFMSAYFPGHGPTMGSPEQIRNYLEFGPFHWSRIPVSIEYYLVGSQELFKQLFKIMDTAYDLVEDPWTSIPSMNPVFFVLMTLGFVKIAKEPRKNIQNNTYIIVGIAGEAVSVFLLLSFMAVTLRYRMDLWALASLTAVLGFPYAIELGDRLDKTKRTALLIVTWTGVIIGIVSCHLTLFEYKLSWFSSRKPPTQITGFFKWAIEIHEKFMSWLF